MIKIIQGDLLKLVKEGHIVKGYGEMGRRVGFVHQKEYVMAKDCQQLLRNTGIVCL